MLQRVLHTCIETNVLFIEICEEILHIICLHCNKELLLLVKTGVLATNKAEILVTLAIRPT